MYSSSTDGASLIHSAVFIEQKQNYYFDGLEMHSNFYDISCCFYLLKVWYKQQLFQSGEELTNQCLQSCIKVRPILHRKHIL